MMAGVFASDADAAIWHEKWCARCCSGPYAAGRYQNEQTCPIWSRAMSGRKPNHFREHAVEGYRCLSFVEEAELQQWITNQPEGAQGALFPQPPRQLSRVVAVAGWPDHPPPKKRTAPRGSGSVGPIATRRNREESS